MKTGRPKTYETMYERLLANSYIPEGQSETTGCWLWKGGCDRKGYGRVSEYSPETKKSSGKRAHRVMAQCFREEPMDPDEETVEHLCYVTGCINPDHQIDLTRAANAAARFKR